MFHLTCSEAAYFFVIRVDFKETLIEMIIYIGHIISKKGVFKIEGCHSKS